LKHKSRRDDSRTRNLDSKSREVSSTYMLLKISMNLMLISG
jgi:hypothetical protein